MPPHLLQTAVASSSLSLTLSHTVDTISSDSRVQNNELRSDVNQLLLRGAFACFYLLFVEGGQSDRRRSPSKANTHSLSACAIGSCTERGVVRALCETEKRDL